MLNANYEKKYVATYKEIASVFVAFTVVLIFLYPKGLLKQQILSEKSNYDLSMLYLKNMLKNDTSNEELMLILAQQSLRTGKKDLSLKLLELLSNSKNKKIKAGSYILRYQLAKENYYYLRDNNMTTAQVKQYHKLQKLFKTMVKEDLYNEEDVKNLYQEASFLKDTYSSGVLVQRLLVKRPQDITLLTDAFYIARKNNDNKKAVGYIDKLLALGVENPQKWIEAKSTILLEDYNYRDALDILQKEARTSEYWQFKLATFYLHHKQYQKALDIYIKILKSKDNFGDKKELFKKVCYALQGSNKVQDATKLAYKYENYFFKDVEMRALLLKIYISANDLEKARALSKRILKGRN